MSDHRPIRGKHILPQICAALGIDNTRVRRIVLDMNMGLVVAYVELLGDTRLIEINWAGGLEKTEVKFADDLEITVQGGNPKAAFMHDAEDSNGAV